MSGTIALVGAPGATVGQNVAEGLAYVYTESGTTWSQDTYPLNIQYIDNDYNYNFGDAVALSGTTALVGGNEAGIANGNAWVFVLSGTASSLVTELSADDGDNSDRFGEFRSDLGDHCHSGSARSTCKR